MLRLGGASQDAGIAPVVAYFDEKGESNALLFGRSTSAATRRGVRATLRAGRIPLYILAELL